MPYTVREAGGSWQVVKDGTGKVMGTHPTEEEAKKQLAALYANEQMSADTFKRVSDSPIKLLPVGKWFRGDRELDLNPQRLQEVVANFKSGLPRYRVGIDLDHAEDGGKVGNVSDIAYLEGEAAPKGDGVYITDYDLTPKGEKAVLEDGYDGVSAEIVWSLLNGGTFQDPVDGSQHDNVLTGVALTPRPFFGHNEVAIFSAGKESMRVAVFPGNRPVGPAAAMGEAEKLAVTKSEADGDHPSSHYLVVEDPQLPSTWHLRYKGMDGKVDTGLLGGAWAALHQGYRGNKYEGPDKAEAMKRLMAAYHDAGMQAPSERSSSSSASERKEEHMEGEELKAQVETLAAEKAKLEETFAADKKALEDKLASIEAERKAEKLAARKAELTAEAKAYEHLSVEVAEYAEKFSAIEAADPELAKWFREQFAAHDKAAGAVTAEFGTDLEGIEDPSARFLAAVDTIQKSDKLNYGDALKAATAKYPTLAEAYANKPVPTGTEEE